MVDKIIKDFDKASEVKKASEPFAMPNREETSPSMEQKRRESSISDRIGVSIIRFMDEHAMGLTYTPHNSAVVQKKHPKKAIALLTIGLLGFLLPEVHQKPISVGPALNEIIQKCEHINQDIGCIFPELVKKPVVLAHAFNMVESSTKEISSEISKVFFLNKSLVNEYESKISGAVKAKNIVYTQKSKEHVIEVLSNMVINEALLYRAQVMTDDDPSNDNILENAQLSLMQKKIDEVLSKKSEELLAEFTHQ